VKESNGTKDRRGRGQREKENSLRRKTNRRTDRKRKQIIGATGIKKKKEKDRQKREKNRENKEGETERQTDRSLKNVWEYKYGRTRQKQY